MKKNKFQY